MWREVVDARARGRRSAVYLTHRHEHNDYSSNERA